MAYSPFLTMPNELKKLQMEVLECHGSHMIFPYGKVHKPSGRTNMPEPYDTSVTIRGFFYRADTTTDASLQIFYNNSYYFTTFTRSDQVLWSSAGAQSKTTAHEFPIIERNSEGFFSIAVQIDGKYLLGICNTQKSPLRDMSYIKSVAWQYNLESTATLVSLHHYAADISKVSNDYWDVRALRTPLVSVYLGAFAVYTLEYKGGSTDLKFEFDGKSGSMAIPISKGEGFTISVLNSPDGYFVHSSFQDAVVQVPRASGRYLPDAIFSSNVYVIRVVIKAGL